MKHQCPQFFFKLFRWLCNPEYFDELQGDLEEDFYDNIELLGIKKARRIYRFEVLKMLRPSVLLRTSKRSKLNHFIMFRNYYKTSWRSMMRNPMSTLINLLGLSAAIGICVLGFAFGRYSEKIDQFHELKRQVHLITFSADRDGSLQENGRAPAPIGALAAGDLAQIRKVCRIEDKSAVVKYDNKVFHEQLRFADPTFFEMFTFPLKWGVPEALYDVNSVILSEDMAIKYFGDTYPVGEHLKVIFAEDRSKTFKVAGVAAEFPGARSFSFDFLVHLDNYQVADPATSWHDWSDFTRATFVQVDDQRDLAAVEKGLQRYVAQQNQADSNWKIESFNLRSLEMLYKKSDGIRGDIAGSNGYTVLRNSKISFVVIGIFVLVLASLNYVNIAIVSAARRLKEIGLRKVIGANRRMVIVQFLMENVLVMSIAIVMGFLLGSQVFIPWLERTMSFDMDFQLADPGFLVLLPVVLLFTAVVSGIYPAFYISRFEVANIFRGSLRIGKKNLTTKIFLGVQLVIACVLVSVAVMFSQNQQYQSQRSWGYEQERVIYTGLPDYSSFQKLGAEMALEPYVESLSGSAHHLGRAHDLALINTPEKDYEVYKFDVDFQYFEVQGLELQEGSFFRSETDHKSIVVNETLVRQLQLDLPIGHILELDSSKREIVGVLRDFHAYDFYNQVRPTVFSLAQEADYRFLTVKVPLRYRAEAYDKLQALWVGLFPEIPFDGGRQKDVWGDFNDDMMDGVRFWRALATIVLLIGGLGLYGMVTLNISGRSKEFSIRKVLGARVATIAKIITKQYWLIFLVALGIGAPASFYMVSMIFDLFYVYYMPLNYFFMMYSGGVLVLVLVLIVLVQVRRLSLKNPVEGLRVE